MDFEQLKIFLAVAEHLSFTRAAETMYISHSTTSRSVAALEERLGVQLLERDNRRVRLTPAGELLTREGRRLLENISALEDRVRLVGSQQHGELTVAALPITTSDTMAAFTALCADHPHLRVAIHHRSTGEIRDQLANRTADAGITFSFALPEDLSPYRVLHVAQVPFCLVTAPDHPLARRTKVGPEHLAELTLLTTPELPLPVRFPARETVSVPTVETLFFHVRAGGTAVVPLAMAHGRGGCAAVALDGVEESCTLDVFWHAADPNPCLPLLIQAMEENRRIQ